MAVPAPAKRDVPGLYTVAQYTDLVRQGVLGPDDHVELLEGVIVAMSPKNPWHDTAVNCVADALRRAVEGRAAVRCQSSLVLPASVLDPDVAVVPGTQVDYAAAHPDTALLVVECADWSLPQDRLSKARIYARAGIVEYWIVSRRDDAVEVFRSPTPDTASYGTRFLARRGQRLTLVAFADTTVDVAELLPPVAAC